MGSAIAKVAFQPPDANNSAKYLANNCKGSVQFAKSSDDESIAFMHFTPVKRSALFAGQSAVMTGKVTSAAVAENAKYTLLYCHGNAEDLAHSHQSYQELSTRLGCEIFAFDYPGYSASTGSPSEDGAINAGEAILDHILNKICVSRDRVILVGRSLGSGIATELASRHRKLGGLVLISPLKSCAAVAGSAAYYGAYMFDLFPNIRRISKVTDYPMLIFAGDNDTVVPYEHSLELSEEGKKYNKQVTFTRLAGAGHNDIEQVRGKEFYSGFFEFIATAAEKRDKLNNSNRKNDDDDDEGGATTCFSSSSSSSLKK